MKLELQSIGVWSFVKVAFFVNLVIGFLFGIPAAFLAGLMSAVMKQMGQFSGSSFSQENVSFGVLIVVLPVVYSLSSAFFGTLFGAIAVVAYNLIARLLGGLELNLVDVTQQVAPTAPSPVFAQTPPPPPPPAPPAQPAPPPSSSGIDPFDPDRPRQDGDIER